MEYQELNINEGGKKHLILIIIPVCLSIVFLITTIIFLALYINAKNNTQPTPQEPTPQEQNYYKPSEEQYIPIIENMNLEGADVFRGKIDILNSKYYKAIDVYNLKSSGNLVLLEKFKTYQQTANYTCGCASLIMCAYHIDGKIINESECAVRAKSSPDFGTDPENLEKALTEFGYDYESKRKGFKEDEIPSYDEYKFAEYVKNSIKNNEPIIIASNDWAGHYTVIIGYDDMGTDVIEDDVAIVADPFDTSDHICDGYTIWSFDRLYYQMVVDIFNIEGFSYEFIKVKKKS